MTDRGLDSRADMRMLTRLLLAGLVAVVVVGTVVLILSGSWTPGIIIVVTYAAVAGSQWVAVFARLRRTRAERAREARARDDGAAGDGHG